MLIALEWIVKILVKITRYFQWEVKMRLLLLVAATIAVSACGVVSSAPVEEDGERAIASQIQEDIGDNPYRIQNFAKTNGVAGEAGGIKTYIMMYSAVIDYPKGVHPNCATENFAGWECWNLRTGGAKVVPVGHREDVAGEIRFVETENGWNAVDLKMQVKASPPL